MKLDITARAPKEFMARIRALQDDRPKGEYNYHQVYAYIGEYTRQGGECLQLNEETYGGNAGNWILYGDNLKTMVITECPGDYLAGPYHTIRAYVETPKKYQEIIDGHENGETEWDTFYGVLCWTETGKAV